ncbi:MAG: ZIP family metal transporter [Acidimicrobiales bacterium]|nr:ZIP family metal transporter [Acidimicrobiales bacterium]
MDVVLLSAIFAVVTLGSACLPFTFNTNVSTRQLENLTAIASGFLLVSAILVVLPEGFHIAIDTTDSFVYSPIMLGLAAFAGFIFMLLLEGIGIGHAIHEEHHDHEDGHGHGHVHHPRQGPILTLGLSIHALADGVAVGVAAAAGETSFTIFVAIGVLVHRIPAAVSLGLFSLHEEGGIRKSIRNILVFTVASPLAIIASYFLFDGAGQGTLAIVLLFSAGTFIYVATVDTLPAIHNPETGRRLISFVLIGAIVLAGLLLIGQQTGWFEHSHSHGDHEGHDDHDSDTRVVIAGVQTERCEALAPECGFGYDYVLDARVDLWELNKAETHWVLKKEYEDTGVRCEALTEACGWRWFPNTESYIDVWVFDYGSMEFIENPDLSSIPAGLEPGDPPVSQPGRES